jgi:hypothetical protein
MVDYPTTGQAEYIAASLGPISWKEHMQKKGKKSWNIWDAFGKCTTRKPGSRTRIRSYHVHVTVQT